MLLKNLIKNYPKSLGMLQIKGLALSSKNVKKGFIFFALKGSKINGDVYIDDAIQKGAKLIICSKNCKFKSKQINIIKTNKVTDLLGQIISKFYSHKPKNIFAVTGTNGKTSVADFFCQILNLNKIQAASIGTFGIKFKNRLIKTNLTSPDIITLHKNLELIKKKKIDNVIIEASSHGLHQNRLNSLKFKGGIFTNFSQDHLDYHKTMKAYLDAKLILFKKLLIKKDFLISDSKNKTYPILKNISKKKSLKLLDIRKDVNIPTNHNLPLVGSFQLKNLSMAILAANLCGLSKNKIFKSLKKIKNVNGRLELIKTYPYNKKVFIDYAHTPDALQETLKSIKENFNSKISLVFGCGGERDYKKRSTMAKIAKSYCEKIYVTDDNPRNENPDKIRGEIIKSLKGSKYFNIGLRSRAIKTAILKAESNEVILIAGKGHENFQYYKNKILKISDKKIVKELNFTIKKKTGEDDYANSKILNKILRNEKKYKFNAISIDSRNLKKGNLFLAIKGKNSDGSKFISKALKKGASYAVTSKIIKNNKKKIIKINNTMNFLNEFAKLKRINCNSKILAITGSAGKTSLKNIIFDLLQEYGKSHASPKSYNNHYGVPLSLSNLNQDHRFGIFEIGMNKPGEINQLSKMLKPNIGVITNIGEAHIENFRNIKEIAKAKGEMINNITNKGTIILNRDDKFFHYLAKKAKSKNLKVLSFGKSNKSFVQLLSLIKRKNIKEMTIRIKDELLKLKIKNLNIYNILASLAVLKELNLDLQIILKKFESFQPSAGRGKLHKVKRYKKNFKLIDESYNANPLSVSNALKNFSEIKKNRFKKYLLLGDMLELGEKSAIYHKKLSQLINNSDIDKVFIKGDKSMFTYKDLKKEKRGNVFQCIEDVDLILKNIIANNDYLMIKGSNATGLNVISNAMIKGI